jgi:hypothetical protein
VSFYVALSQLEDAVKGDRNLLMQDLGKLLHGITEDIRKGALNVMFMLVN